MGAVRLVDWNLLGDFVAVLTYLVYTERFIFARQFIVRIAWGK
jgi:hypothetical protein